MFETGATPFLLQEGVAPVLFCAKMIPGSKGLNPHELAWMWWNVLSPPASYYSKIYKRKAYNNAITIF